MIGMTTVFKNTFRPVLIMSKLFGIVNISYVLEPSGLLVRNTNSSYYSVLETSRMGALLISTFFVYSKGGQILQIILLFKFWFVIVAARISETSLIKLINGIIEYDQNIAKLPKIFLDHHRSYSETYWNKVIIVLFTYFTGFEVCQIYLWPPHLFNIATIISYMFIPPYAIDFAVIICSCFYLYNIDIRFQSLNDFWKRVPTGLVAVPEQWTHCEIAMLVENIRLLHAELSGLLKVFSRGYGSLILGFFVFGIISILVQFFFMISINFAVTKLNISNFFWKLIPHVLNAQVVLFMTYTIVIVSHIHEKRKRILSYLRLYSISNLPLDIKRQVKMFMNQISVFEFDEITAFGFFDINLNLIVSVLVLIVTGLSTLIQMKEHSIILKLANDTTHFMKISHDNVLQNAPNA